MMSDDDNDSQMIFGDLGGLKLPDICLTGEEKPQKTSLRRPVPTGDRTWARCVTGAHAAVWPTVVDSLKIESIQNFIFNLIGILVSKILIFKLILICRFQNVPSALRFKVKH